METFIHNLDALLANECDWLVLVDSSKKELHWDSVFFLDLGFQSCFLKKEDYSRIYKYFPTIWFYYLTRSLVVAEIISITVPPKSWFVLWQTWNKQDCIPVGCVPPARWPYLPACSAPGGCLLLGGVPGSGWVYLVPGGVCSWGCTWSRGGCLLGGCTWSRGVPGSGGCTWSGTPPCGQTHACKHITLPQTSFAGGNYRSPEWHHCACNEPPCSFTDLINLRSWSVKSLIFFIPRNWKAWSPCTFLYSVISIGGSKGGAPGTRAPWGSKFFHFHAVFSKNLKNNSNFGSWHTPLGKIRDPPLISFFYKLKCTKGTPYF